jgi:hypothetical protein
MWVHGTSVHEEYPDMISESVRKGWGAHFVSAPYVNQNWFHFSITTPILLGSVRPSLEKVFVFYDTDLNEDGVSSRITNLHIYDGRTKVKAFDGLELAGDHSRNVDNMNRWVIEPSITIRYGLGISLGVEFSTLYLPEAGEIIASAILLTAAGADFLVDQ